MEVCTIVSSGVKATAALGVVYSVRDNAKIYATKISAHDLILSYCTVTITAATLWSKFDI
jgi:hypothetical protein